MKLEKVFEEYKKAAQRKIANDQETAKLRRKRKDLEFQFGEAAENEDRERAKAIRGEINDLLGDLEINERIQITAKVTAEEVEGAWKEYANEIGSNVMKKQAEIVKARKTLKKLVEEMLAIQNDALKMRETLAKYTRHDPKEYRLTALANDGERVPVASKLKNPDVLYLASSGEWRMDKTFRGDDAVNDAYMIICVGKHVEKLHF